MSENNEKALTNDQILGNLVTPESVDGAGKGDSCGQSLNQTMEFRYFIKARVSKEDLQPSNLLWRERADFRLVTEESRGTCWQLGVTVVKPGGTIGFKVLAMHHQNVKNEEFGIFYKDVAERVFGTEDEEYLDAVLYENSQAFFSIFTMASKSELMYLFEKEAEGENYLSGKFKHYSTQLECAAMSQEWRKYLHHYIRSLDTDIAVIKFIHHLVRVGTGDGGKATESPRDLLKNIARILWRAPSSKGESWVTEGLNLLKTMMERHGDWHDPKLKVESVLRSLEGVITKCRGCDWSSAAEVAQLLMTKVKEAHPERSRRYYEYNYRRDFPSPSLPVTVAALPPLQITSISFLPGDSSLPEEEFCCCYC